MESTILWTLAALLLVSLCTCRDHKLNPNPFLKLDENLNIKWTINTVKKTIQFKVKATIHETGWFVIGFEPQKAGKAPEAVTETRGDAFVVWRQIVNSGQNKTHTWSVTVRTYFVKKYNTRYYQLEVNNEYLVYIHCSCDKDFNDIQLLEVKFKELPSDLCNVIDNKFQ